MSEIVINKRKIGASYPPYMIAGDVITNEHIKRIRSGFGLPPKFEKQLLGKTVKVDIKRGTTTSWELINE